MCPRFSFVIALAEINIVNDFRVPRDSEVKYKFIFQSTLHSVSPSWFLKLPNMYRRTECLRVTLRWTSIPSRGGGERKKYP